MTIQELSAVWAPWKIGEVLGKGSFGTVYKITKEEFGRTYVSALKHISIPMDEQQKKALFSEGITTKENMSDFYKQIMMDLRKEIETTYVLKGHTNIVSYEDHKIIPKKDGIGYDIFIKMEYLKSLSDVIVERGLTTNDVVKLGIDLCRALETLEREKIIHRDIKPSNLFVNANGDYKLGDFGVARELNKTVSGLSVKGTYKYMPPEIFMGENINFTADIYSLGLVMYVLLNNNRAPFLSPTAEMISYEETERANYKRMRGEKLPKPHNADQKLASIILKACEHKPSDRWQNAKDFREALEKYRKAHPAFNLAEEKTVYNPNPMRVKNAVKPTATTPANVNTGNSSVQKNKNGNNKTVILIAVIAACVLFLAVIGIAVGKRLVDNREAIESTTVTTTSVATTEKDEEIVINGDDTTKKTTKPSTDKTTTEKENETESNRTTTTTTTKPTRDNQQVSVPESTESPQNTYLNPVGAGNVVNLRSHPRMGKEYVIREESESKPVTIHSYTNNEGYFWVYIELERQFYWVRVDEITDMVLE